MSRLTVNDIKNIPDTLRDNDTALLRELGFTLDMIAKKATGVSSPASGFKTAVVPITSGLGIIEGFSRSIEAILQHCAIDVFVTENTDVAGLQEAYRKAADIVFMADDAICSAFSTQGRIFSDNGYATGISFAAALTEMMDKVENQEILVLGAGPVGMAASQYLAAAGAIPVICDLQEEKAVQVADGINGARVERDVRRIGRYSYILEATPVSGLITERDVTPQTRISAPGMPLGVTGGVTKMIPVFHNPLELGIMTMYYDCLRQMGGEG